MRSISLFVLLWCCRASIMQEEVEIAALIGLQNAFFKQFCIAALRGFSLWR